MDMKELNVNFPKQIAKFESLMKSQFLVRTLFYEKVFGGKGMEFESFRKYTPNDDASLIDWKATMKANSLLARQYVEERALKIFFIVDVGENMIFGSGLKLKNEVAAEITACLSHLIVNLGDSMGFVLYNDGIVYRRMLLPGIKQFNILAVKLSDSKTYGGISNLKKTLESISPYLGDVSAVFIISDFIRIDKETEEELRKFMRRYETIGIMVRDPIDTVLPDLNREIVIEDVYTGEQLLINPKLIAERYTQNALEQKNKVKWIFKEAGSDLIELYTDKDFVYSLSEFLKSRVKHGKYILPRR